MAKYIVTDNAPDTILGKTVAAGDTISLTKAEAEHPLRKGHVERVEEKAEPTEQNRTDAARGKRD